MRKFLVIFEKSGTGYSAYVPDLPGCAATAPSKEKVEQLIYEGIQFHIEGLKLESLPIPQASSEAETVIFAQ